jgi:hypothetical protein
VIGSSNLQTAQHIFRIGKHLLKKGASRHSETG